MAALVPGMGAHASVLNRRKSEASVLRDFEAAGTLVICDQLGEDIAEIASIAGRIDAEGLLHAVALDPFGVGSIVDALAEVGIAGQDKVVGISQGWKLSGAIKTAERKLADGSLTHSGQSLMAWAVGNASRTAGECHCHYKASLGDGQDRSADGGVQRHCADGDESCIEPSRGPGRSSSF